MNEMSMAERNQKEQVATLFLDAQEMVVTDDASYVRAGEIARQVKQMQSTVRDYWEEVILPAKAAYDAVRARKKEMLSPLEQAEQQLKDKMTNYQRSVVEAARKVEAERKAAAEAERNRLLAEAQAFRQDGDTVGAEMSEMEADMMEMTAQTTTVTATTPTAAGVSKRRDWEIISIDKKAVPTESMGVVIRPVDERAIKRIIKQSGGTVQIPGVVYRETVSITVRK